MRSSRTLPAVLAIALSASACGSHRRAEVPPAGDDLRTGAEATATGDDILTRAEWGARPPVLPMRPHRPTRLTIHHTGTLQNRERSLADKLRGLQQFSQRDDSLASGRKKPAWPDVPYHYYVDVHGEVAEGREAGYVGDTNTEYDPTGHLLVVLEGNFEREQPTAGQLATLRELTLDLTRRWRIPADSIAGHRDFAVTTCPGRALYDYLPELRRLVAGAGR